MNGNTAVKMGGKPSHTKTREQSIHCTMNPTHVDMKHNGKLNLIRVSHVGVWAGSCHVEHADLAG
jgi:hypothetical protein